MSDRINKITFLENPWPNGHKIIEKNFTLFLDRGTEGGEDDFTIIKPEDAGIYMRVSVYTEPYSASGDMRKLTKEQEDKLTEWQEKVLWNNYYQGRINCQLPVPIATLKQPVDLSNIANYTFYKDKVEDMEEIELDDFSFFCYILGHDSVAGHNFKFVEKEDKLDLLWTGKVARSYVADYEFKFDFEAQLFDLDYKIAGLEDEESSQNLFRKVVSNYQDFEFKDGYFILKSNSKA
jgi:hypothetical protein